MRFRALMLCGMLALVAGATASSYSDFNAGLAIRDRDNDAAVRYLTSALADPGLLPAFRAVALRSRAEAYQRQDKTDLALADYNASLALKSDYDGHISRGLLYLQRDDTDRALSDFNAAGALRPDLLLPPLLRIRLYVARDRFDDALAEETQLLDFYKGYPPLYALRATTYRGKGDYTAAMAEADYATKIVEDATYGYDEKASIYEDQGKFDDALDSIKRKLRISSDDFNAWFHKGVLLWEMKKYRDAEDAFSGALKRDGASAYAAMWLLIVRRLAHGEADADKAFKNVKTTGWPAPVIAMLRGAVTPEATIALARTTDGFHRDQICDAEFYGAQWYLMNQNLAAAEPLMAAAGNDCPVNAYERAAARLQTWR